MNLKYTFIPLGLVAVLSAEITIVGNQVDYTSNDPNWLSHTTYDIDANGLGTDGFFFFGDYANNGSRNIRSFQLFQDSLPSYVSNVSQGAGFSRVAEGFSSYGVIDSPISLDGSDAIAGFAYSVIGSAGSNNEILTFDVTGLSGNKTVRVGVLAGIHGASNGRWDPTSITLSDGESSATVGDHNTSPLPSDSPHDTSWVFFDIDQNGTYSVSVTRRFDTQGAGIGGITFDSAPKLVAKNFVLPHIGEAALESLQSESGDDGDLISTAVRQLRIENRSYLPNAIVPIGAYAPGTVHKLVVNSSWSDSTALLEFAVNAGGVLDLVNFHQSGADQIDIINAGASGDSLELALHQH